jgi:adenine phosphoribosyltransferase
MKTHLEHIKSHIRDIPDFPKPGIIFRDITPLLKDPSVFRAIIETLAERYSNLNISKIAAIESRGFVFATPLAYELGVGFAPLRKEGKLPYETLSEAYSLEYGQATIEVHRDAAEKGERVLLFDDLLATGGTATASLALLDRLGAEVVEACFVIELAGLGGRQKIVGPPVFSLVKYE